VYLAFNYANPYFVFCRWDEDVVFKNQTRGEVKAARRFINDTVRSDFHKKFLERYIR
jgi:protein CWC15